MHVYIYIYIHTHNKYTLMYIHIHMQRVLSNASGALTQPVGRTEGVILCGICY